MTAGRPVQRGGEALAKNRLFVVGLLPTSFATIPATVYFYHNVNQYG
jgi:hypothetical protein